MTYSRLARHLTDQEPPPDGSRPLRDDPVLYDYCVKHGLVADPTAKTVETTRQPDPAWKKAVLEQAGGTCEYVDNGKRCVVAKDLHAISFKPGSKRPEDGTALCPHHVDVVENGTENG